MPFTADENQGFSGAKRTSSRHPRVSASYLFVFEIGGRNSGNRRYDRKTVRFPASSALNAAMGRKKSGKKGHQNDTGRSIGGV
jgi:hypothetical protein